MAEQENINITQENAAQQNPTEPAGNPGKPDTLQFTQDALNALNREARERGERTILKQLGIDNKDKLPDVLSAFNAWQEAQRNALTDADKLKDLNSKYEHLQGDVAARDAELAALKQEKVLRSHGLTDDEDVEIYGIRIGKLVTDDKTFEQAAQEYFEAHPRKPKASASALNSGTGRTSMTATELDSLKADYEKARKQGNSPKMVELRMLAKQKGLTFD